MQLLSTCRKTSEVLVVNAADKAMDNKFLASCDGEVAGGKFPIRAIGDPDLDKRGLEKKQKERHTGR